jgi:hypothetical protein
MIRHKHRYIHQKCHSQLKTPVATLLHKHTVMGHPKGPHGKICLPLAQGLPGLDCHLYRHRDHRRHRLVQEAIQPGVAPIWGGKPARQEPPMAPAAALIECARLKLLQPRQGDRHHHEQPQRPLRQEVLVAQAQAMSVLVENAPMRSDGQRRNGMKKGVAPVVAAAAAATRQNRKISEDTDGPRIETCLHN